MEAGAERTTQAGVVSGGLRWQYTHGMFLNTNVLQVMEGKIIKAKRERRRYALGKIDEP